MDPEDNNIYAYNIIDRYENHPDNSDDKYLADFTASYIFEKADINYEQKDEKSYIKPVAEIHKEEDLEIVITKSLKNVGKSEEKNSNNYNKISQYQRVEES